MKGDEMRGKERTRGHRPTKCKLFLNLMNQVIALVLVLCTVESTDCVIDRNDDVNADAAFACDVHTS